MSDEFDIIIVGAGIAGASVAAELSAHARVLLLEREKQPGYHSTGRSAAAFIPSYGHTNLSLRYLTKASFDFLKDLPAPFAHKSVLHPRGLLTVAPRGKEHEAHTDFVAQQKIIPSIFDVDLSAMRRLLPAISGSYSNFGWYEPDVYDIDVHTLHEGYLRKFRHNQGQHINSATISLIAYQVNSWKVIANETQYSAKIVVNAAGAWSDELAELAGVKKIGLMPLRRTAVLVDPPKAFDISAWPLLFASDASFYLKPDAGLLLASPADEHPSAPCDAQPEELDVAYAAHYVQEALDIEIKQVRHKWAGLRNFVADRSPVVGFDKGVKNFFWVTGQGGHGIQTAPAIARLAANLILRGDVPVDLKDMGFDERWVCPSRCV